MNTLLTVVLVAFAVASLVYLFNVVSGDTTNEKGKCSSKDYEIAEKVAAKKN